MLILSIFRKTKSSYHIQAGKFDRDYFFIQKKPKLDALLVDEKSAVIVINNAGKKRVILHGFHFISNGEKALHTFDIGFHHFFWGPQETEKLFKNHIPDLDLSQAHLYSLRVAQTKCKTKDEITVVPSFSVFYDFSSPSEKNQLGEMLLDISDLFSANKIFGELQLEINELIGKHVTNICKDLLENTNAKQLTDQNSSLMDDILIKINTKVIGDTSDSRIKKEHRLLESIKPLGYWKMLNIRVFLNNLWIEKDVR
jgi:DNA-binding ferritin-like protein (Dps family)